MPIGAARHVGIYAFRVQALVEFVALGESRLEEIERLEQLRWLEAGKDLLVLSASRPVPGGVDTPSDLARVQALFSA
jgi:3-deoxy-manno-octulosonate cytidylyltransferase (CMP-KDO synthetase)